MGEPMTNRDDRALAAHQRIEEQRVQRREATRMEALYPDGMPVLGATAEEKEAAARVGEFLREWRAKRGRDNAVVVLPFGARRLTASDLLTLARAIDPSSVAGIPE